MADFGSLAPDVEGMPGGYAPQSSDPTADMLRRLLFMRSGMAQMPAQIPQEAPQPQPSRAAGIRSLLPLFTSMGGAQAVVDNPATVLSVAGGLPGQIMGAAMENQDLSNQRGMSPMGAPRSRPAPAPAAAVEGPSLDSLMDQKKSLAEQRASLDRQRATAVADRDMELRGGKDASGRPVQGGRGRNYDAKQAEVTRLTGEMTSIDSGLERLDGMITGATKRMSPEYQMQQQKVREAEGVREQMLGEVRKPFHEEFPTWSKVQAFAPAAAGALTMGGQAAINALGNRFKVGKWKDVIEAAGKESGEARKLNADISAGYSKQFAAPKKPSAWDNVKPYGAAATLGGAEGAALTNAPEVYNAFLPPLNQERQAYEEYLKRLPADHPERARVQEMIAGMPERNPYREAAMDYFSSPAVLTRTLVGAAEGAGGAMAGKTVGGMLEPSLPRAEAEALAKSMRRRQAPAATVSVAPAKTKTKEGSAKSMRKFDNQGNPINRGDELYPGGSGGPAPYGLLNAPP